MRTVSLVAAGLICLMNHHVFAQDSTVPVVKFDAIESLIEENTDKVRVINFWATWCAPCIKELPHFEEALREHEGEIELYLISLDYADQLDKVKNFVAKKSLTGSVMILDELDYNSWIDRVDPTWSGAIPATLFIIPATGERKFLESELTREEINNHLTTLLN